MQPIQLLIIDLGSQYTSLIERTIRELGVRSVVLSAEQAVSWLQEHRPRGIILSGGSASVTDEDAPSLPREILERQEAPILGICYGMQLLAHELGGAVFSERASKEYGASQVRTASADPLFAGVEEISQAWVSHGDTVERVPPGFAVVATSANDGAVAAMSSPERKCWGVQFHPEVQETIFGRKILENFVFELCGCEKDWSSADVIEEVRNEVLDAAGDGAAIGGFSGGVDSSTLFAILAPVLGRRLRGVCIDGGQLREGELSEIQKHAEALGVELRVVEARDRFQEALQGVTDAEKKRREFSKLYGQILEEEASAFDAEFLLQGSLAPDYIESGRRGTAALIKPHHNVGLAIKLQELHPFRKLFKYEVRALARTLKLPEVIAEREPFPGPGLFVRVVGVPPTPERLEVVRWADREVRTILQAHGVKEHSQLVVGLLGTPTVGVKGDARVYEPSLVVRAVRTTDFMTATGIQLPAEVRREIGNRLTKHPAVVRVFFDETDKPPATIELE